MFSYNFKRNALKHIIFCGLLLNTSFLTTTTSFAAPSIEAGIQSANDELIAYGSSRVYDVYYSLYKDGRLVIEGAGGFNRSIGPISGFIKEEYLDQAKNLIIKNIRWIKSSAFENCKNVTTVTFDSSGSLDVETIEDYAFKDCSSLKTITIPKDVSEMGSYVFYYCKNLETVTLPTTLETIEYNAFSNSGLTSIFIPKGVTSISSTSFNYCGKLSTISVSDENTTYDSRNNCNAIIQTATNQILRGTSNTIIPNTATSIGDNAFNDINSLTSIVIPESVTSIGQYAFYYCNSLAEVVCKAKVAPQLKSDAFSNDVLSKATLYVPEESVESYKADGEWKKFSDIQPLPYAYINISAAEKTTYCSEHALDFTNIEGAKAYIASGFSPSTGVVLLTKVDKVPARVGFMVIGKEGKYEVPYCETDFTYANLLVGTMSQTTVASTADGKTNYVLSKGSDGVMFYLANNAMVPAKKAYLSIPSTIVDETHVKAVRLAFEDDMTTNIIRVEDMTKKTTDKVYGLDGRCKMGLSSGINIVNGKKIYVK